MTSAKLANATYHMTSLLQEWDRSSKEKRRIILQDFISQHQNKSGPEIDMEMAQMGSLFLARVSVWMKLTYVNGHCLTEQLETLYIFLSASSSHTYLTEFLEHGGVLCLLEIICLLTAKEVDKYWSLRVLQCVADSGTKFKEVICECYGIRAIAECLAKSKSEETQEAARNLLESLAEGNPRFVNQVYKGFIGVLPCNSPKAQRMAAQSLRNVQRLVKTAHRAIIQRCLVLLETLHMEVQSAAIELIRDLMSYDIQTDLVRSLVNALRPAAEVHINPTEESIGMEKIGNNDEEAEGVEMNTIAMPSFIQQAAAAKCIKILAVDSTEVSEKLIQMNVISNLLYAMGNVEYADSQRQASITLAYLCQTYSIVDEKVREAMGPALYAAFIDDPEALYNRLTAIQADVLLSNKVKLYEFGGQADIEM